MHRELLLWYLPYAAMLVASGAALWLLGLLSGVRVDWTRVCQLHRDQRGGVQSLSFVLTLPLFVMIMMFIVQLSQLMIARTMVEYASFAAARSAVVWIPANLGPAERENQIAALRFSRTEVGSDGQTYSVYQVVPRSPKFDKIHFAAAMSCLPVCPSRDTGVGRAHPGNAGMNSLARAYYAVAPSQAENPRVPSRLSNKLAYALANTAVRIEIWHKEEEPPLARWEVPPHVDEFEVNEIGWQDQVHVSVLHRFALLPGPGRLLAGSGDNPPPDEAEATNEQQDDQQFEQPATQDERIGRRDELFVYNLIATTRMSNEGEKSVLPFFQTLSGALGEELEIPTPPDDETPVQHEAEIP